MEDEEEIVIDDLEEDLAEIELEDVSNEDIELEETETINIGTKNYNELNNKPQIEGVELQGNKTFEDLGINNKFNELVEENNLENTKITNEEILSIFRR